MTTKDQRIAEALGILRSLDLPAAQLNDRTAICLLALLDLQPKKAWREASDPRLGIRAILDFARTQLARNYAENTRESVRKYSVKALVAAGLVLHNPDKPDRPVNSSDNCYQIEPQALELFKTFGSQAWAEALAKDLVARPALATRYRRTRALAQLPVTLADGRSLTLSPGLHSELIRAVIEVFGPNFVAGGELVYAGDTGEKWGYFDEPLLASLGVSVAAHGKMPDVVLYQRAKNWLVLVEAVASSGPVDAGRHDELAALFHASTAGLVYVTAFPDREALFRKFLSVVAWETEVWCASDPTHLIHFNGDRFLGPYASPAPNSDRA